MFTVQKIVIILSSRKKKRASGLVNVKNVESPS